MATSEILGLFASPEQYQANQMAQFRQRAASEVQSNPFQQAAINMRQAGYQLGGGIAGALGGVDPQLQKITQRQQLLSMIDPANPDSYAQAIQAALKTGDQEAAFLLRNEMVKVKQQAQEEQLNQMKVQDYLTQRGQGMQQRGMEARALSIANGINPDTGEPTTPLFDPSTQTFNRDVANLLVSQYGQTGASIVKQRLEGVQGVETLEVQQLGRQLFNADGTRNKEVEETLSKSVAGRELLKKLAPETKVFKRGDIITEVNPVTGKYDIVTPTGTKEVPAGANPIKAMIDNKSIDKTVTPFAQEIANQWETLDDKGRAGAIKDLTQVNNTALDRNQRRAEAGVGGSDKVQSSKVTPDGTTIVVMKNGTTKVISALGEELKGQSRADAIKASEEFGATTQGTRAQARGVGELTAKQVGQAFAEVGKIKRNIGNIDEAIAAIDAGANTGVIASKLPNINAASIQLANVRNQLGLDVIGSVTFGALSEGELNLALDTALPSTLAPKDLRVYLQNKKTAQTKLAGYLSKQATYLQKPGNTLAGWLEKVENEGTSTPSQLPSGVTVKRKN
jgi:hypothetical protein